jgi:thiosulfate reductase cytochrome b subunit
MALADREPSGVRTARVARKLVYRHRLPTRIWHWLNAAVILVMLMTGLMIFNAHPRLYWGQYGANPDHPWLRIGDSNGQGFLRVGDATFHTTGFLGAWGGPGDQTYTAFPGWLTIPSDYDLALARHWHLTFAWLFVAAIIAYWIWGLGNRHI